MANDAASLLEEFKNAGMTLWFIPRPERNGVVTWNEARECSSLREAVETILDDDGRHIFDIQMHDNSRDLTQAEIAAVADYVKSVRKRS